MKKKDKLRKLDELKYIPTGSNWKKVLLEIYGNSPHSYGESNNIGFYDDSHTLAKKLKISGYELGLAISFLRDNKLIEESNSSNISRSKFPVPKWSNRLSLNENGFEVASRLENQESNKKLQRLIILFTGLATLTGLMIFVKEIFNLDNLIKLRIYVGGILLVLFIMYFENIKDKWKRFIFSKQIKKEKWTI